LICVCPNMSTALTHLVLLFLVLIQIASGSEREVLQQSLQIKGKTFKCTFFLASANSRVNLKLSKLKCTPGKPKRQKASNIELVGEVATYTVSVSIHPSKITKASMTPLPETTPSMTPLPETTPSTTPLPETTPGGNCGFGHTEICTPGPADSCQKDFFHQCFDRGSPNASTTGVEQCDCFLTEQVTRAVNQGQHPLGRCGGPPCLCISTSMLSDECSVVSFAVSRPESDGWQVVTGGLGNGGLLQQVEVFPLPIASDCSIPDLPHARADHSLSLISDKLVETLVICGGFDGETPYSDCISWKDSEQTWSHFEDTSEARSRHTAWTPTDSSGNPSGTIVLLGGAGQLASMSAEILPQSPGGVGFPLSHSGDMSCGIPGADYIIMIGGTTTGGPAHNFVTKYDIAGTATELTALPEARYDAVCGQLSASQAFVVAGGRKGSAATDILSSVVMLPTGHTNWITGTALPSPLAAAAASVVVNDLRVTGGRSTRGTMGSIRKEVMNFDGTAWTEVGNLLRAKSNHAVHTIGRQQLSCLT